MENFKNIAGAKRESDTGDVLLDKFLRVDADDFATRVEQRAAAIAGIDGCVSLNPRAGAGIGKFSNGADDAFGDAEEPGFAGMPDSENIFSLSDDGSIRKREMGEFAFPRSGRNFCECDVEVRIDVDDFGLQLPASRENRVQGFLAAREMGVGNDETCAGNKKPRPGAVQPS